MKKGTHNVHSLNENIVGIAQENANAPIRIIVSLTIPPSANDNRQPDKQPPSVAALAA
jgi:hypothetical protein